MTVYYTLNRILSGLILDYLSQTGGIRIVYIGLQVLSVDTMSKFFVKRNLKKCSDFFMNVKNISYRVVRVARMRSSSKK
jgi:hypothetical protein